MLLVSASVFFVASVFLTSGVVLVFLLYGKWVPLFACDKPKWLKELANLVSGADRPFVLSLPCVEVSAPSQACQCLSVPVRGSAVADLEFALEPALKKIHAGEECLPSIPNNNKGIRMPPAAYYHIAGTRLKGNLTFCRSNSFDRCMM